MSPASRVLFPNGSALPRLYQSDGHSRAIRATDDTDKLATSEVLYLLTYLLTYFRPSWGGAQGGRSTASDRAASTTSRRSPDMYFSSWRR